MSSYKTGLIVLLTLCSNHIFGSILKSKVAFQSYNPPVIKVIIPPSPDAAALAKFAEMPVGLQTGTTNINVPIWELKGRHLSVPVSLNYHTGGVKVEERASSVGLGWALQAGGIITRTVRGIPDEEENGYFNQRWRIADNQVDSTHLYRWEPDNYFLEEVTRGLIDTAPDLYFFNINGRTGQIVFDGENKPYTNPYSKIQFEATPVDGKQSWVLVDENGIWYIFDEKGVETTTSYFEIDNFQQNNTFTSTWHITKISSPIGNEGALGNDEITFHYNDETVAYDLKAPQLYYQDLANSFNSRSGNSKHFIEINTKKLLEINSDLASMEFWSGEEREDLSGGTRLDSIAVKYLDGELLNYFKLKYTYDFFKGYEDHEKKRLTLLSIVNKINPCDKAQPYEFNYYAGQGVEPNNSNMQDHWGYIKGNYDRRHKWTDNINREVDPATVNTAALRKITYPNGLSKEFSYEPNSYSHYDGTPVQETISGSNFFSYQIAESIFYDPYLNGTSNVKRSLSFELNHDQAVDLSILFRAPGGDPSSRYSLTGRGFGLLIKDAISGSIVYSLPTQTIGSINANSVHLELAYLTAGNYILEFSAENNSLRDVAVDAGLNFTEHITHDYTIYEKLGGGLRLKSITTLESTKGQFQQIEKYSYLLPLYPGNEVQLSSGVLTHYPIYDFNYQEINSGAGTKNEYSVRYAESVSYPGASSGGYVLYANVQVESQTRDTKNTFPQNDDRLINNGAENYNYAINPTASFPAYFVTDHTPFSYRTDYSVYNSQLLSKEILSKDGQLVQRISNTYTLVPDQVVMPGFIAGYSVQSDDPGMESHQYYWSVYRLKSDWRYINETIVEDFEYSPNGIPIIHKQNFAYDHNDLQLISQRSLKSNGGELIKHYKYPSQYTNLSYSAPDVVTAGIAKMLAKNMIATPVETYTKQVINGVETVLDATLIKFKEYYSGQILPYEVLKIQNNAPITNFTESNINLSKEFKYDSRYALESTIEQYDAFGYATHSRSRDGVVSVNKWGYNNSLLVAQSSFNSVSNFNPSNKSISYAGFESFNFTEEDGWPLTNVVISPDGRTGKKSIQYINTAEGPWQAFTPEDQNGRYIFSAWVKSDANVSNTSLQLTITATNGVNSPVIITAAAGNTNGKWVYVEAIADLNQIRTQMGGTPRPITLRCSTRNIGQNTIKADDLRFHPELASMNTFTYQPNAGKTSETNTNNITTFQEYDHLHRLKIIRDHLGNIKAHFTAKPSYDKLDSEGIVGPRSIQKNKATKYSIMLTDCENQDYTFTWFKQYESMGNQFVAIPSVKTVITSSNGTKIIKSEAEVNEPNTYNRFSLKCVVTDSSNRTFTFFNDWVSVYQ